ncbi:MAG: energy-coupling factor ABC transporter ATP-binding protein [Muribaculaceae bacterium]|nr:energy-coupling factor ABC transporter ATP-binding protein [Muribaculaceae bacterium]
MSHHYIKFTNVTYRYPDGYKALDAVNLHITHGERVALLGNNGAGKSTLLLHCNGLLLATSGEVNIGGIPVSKKTLPDIRRSVGMVFQNSDDQLFMPTVEEDVAFGPINMNLPAKEVEDRVRKSLEVTGTFDLRNKSPLNLSGGQQRRVAIATVLAMMPSVLVMDEPTSNLDFGARRELIDLLKTFHHTQLIATHDLGLVKDLCNRIIVINEGKIFYDGDTDTVLREASVRNVLHLD